MRALLENLVPIVTLSFRRVNPEGKVRAVSSRNRLLHEIRKRASRVIGIHSSDNLGTNAHSEYLGMDQIRLARIRLAADAFVPGTVIREQRRMGKSVDGALGKDKPSVAVLLMRGPQPLFTARSKAGKVPVLEFITAQPQLVEVGEHSIAVHVHPDHAGEPVGLKNIRRHSPVFL